MAVLAALIGILAVLAAFIFDTSSGGVHNLGRLQSQMMLLHTGLAFLIISAIRWDAGTTMRNVGTPATEEFGEDRVERPGNVRNTHIAIGATFLVLIIIFVGMLDMR